MVKGYIEEDLGGIGTPTDRGRTATSIGASVIDKRNSMALFTLQWRATSQGDGLDDSQWCAFPIRALPVYEDTSHDSRTLRKPVETFKLIA